MRNSAGNLVAQTVNAGCNLVVVFALARHLGKDLLGEYYTVFAVLLAVQMILESGMTTVLTCRIVQAPETWRGTVAEASGMLAVVIVLSVVFMGLIGLGWATWSSDPGILAPFMVAGLACGAIQVERFCAAVFRAFEQFRFENIGRVLQGGSFAGLVLGCCLLDVASPTFALCMLGFSHVLAAVFLGTVLQRQWHCLGWSLSWTVVKGWFHEAVPLGMGDVMRRLTWQLDTLLLGVLQPKAVVGIYSVAYRPLGPLNWVPRAILTALFPSFARLASQDQGLLDRTFAHSSRLLWILSLPIAVAICISAEPVIIFLAGVDYIEAAVPMRILIWISTLSFLSIQFRFLFAAVGRQQLFASLVLITFAIEFVLEVALIPRWGYMGACVGSLVGELIFTVAGLACCWILGLSRLPWPAMLRAALAGAVMAAVLWPVRTLPLFMLFFAVLLAMGLYATLCLWLGALGWSELQQAVEALAAIRHGRRRNPAQPQPADSPAEPAVATPAANYGQESPKVLT